MAERDTHHYDLKGLIDKLELGDSEARIQALQELPKTDSDQSVKAIVDMLEYKRPQRRIHLVFKGAPVERLTLDEGIASIEALSEFPTNRKAWKSVIKLTHYEKKTYYLDPLYSGSGRPYGINPWENDEISAYTPVVSYVWPKLQGVKSIDSQKYPKWDPLRLRILSARARAVEKLAIIDPIVIETKLFTPEDIPEHAEGKVILDIARVDTWVAKVHIRDSRPQEWFDSEKPTFLSLMRGTITVFGQLVKVESDEIPGTHCVVIPAKRLKVTHGIGGGAGILESELRKAASIK